MKVNTILMDVGKIKKYDSDRMPIYAIASANIVRAVDVSKEPRLNVSLAGRILSLRIGDIGFDK